MNRRIDNLSEDDLAGAFQDILSQPGGIRMSGPLPDEFDTPNIANLPRLVLDFNRKDFGRLRCLIDSINRL